MYVVLLEVVEKKSIMIKDKNNILPKGLFQMKLMCVYKGCAVWKENTVVDTTLNTSEIVVSRCLDRG